jgi:hypothetical protein
LTAGDESSLLPDAVDQRQAENLARSQRLAARSAHARGLLPSRTEEGEP